MDIVNSVLKDIILLHGKQYSRIQDKISLSTLNSILLKVTDVLKKEPILINVPSGCHVVGDIHGNIDDLIRIFQETGYPPKEKYLFLGDYEDRGKFGLEVNILLFSLKIKFPNHIFLLRGNHEIQHISQVYGFRSECISKYSEVLFNNVHTVFYELPIAALIGGKIFCVHGGISPKIPTLADLMKYKKPDEVSEKDTIADFLWSDPRDTPEEYMPDKRGCGVFYNSKALGKFLERNNLDLLIRSHELCNGFNFPYENSEKCITIFSNTDYCDQKNTAAIINVSRSLKVTVKKFKMFSPEEKEKWQPILPDWLIHYDKLNEFTHLFEDPFSDPDYLNKGLITRNGLHHSELLTIVQ